MDHNLRRSVHQSWSVPPTQIDSSSDEEPLPAVQATNTRQAKVSNEESTSNADANLQALQATLLSKTALTVLVVTFIIATVSLRDLVFLIVGLVLAAAAGFHFLAKRWEKEHKKSRIVVSWEDLKYNFAAVMEKTDTIHSNKGYFINSFSQGLYQHATFDEQINVLDWVEKTEKRIQAESLSQFDRFVKKNSSQLEKNQLSPGLQSDQLKIPDSQTKKPADAGKMAVQVSLRDTSGLFTQLDGLLLKNIEDKGVKDLLSDMKGIISDLNKSVEEGLTLWSELDNQTFQKLRKIFTQEPTKNPMALFGWTEESLKQNAPNLVVAGSALRRYLDFITSRRSSMVVVSESALPTVEGLRKSSDPVTTTKKTGQVMLLNTDWTEFRKRLDTLENLQIGMGQGATETIQRLSKLSDECQKHIQDGTENIKKLKDYFGETRSKLGDLEKDFGSKISIVKAKIKEYREAVDKLADSEIILRLEYEVRLEIQRLYTIKNAHEKEASGLERRLAEIEAFNASTVEIENTLYSQILEFAESSEDGLLPQVSNYLLSRLQSMVGNKDEFPNLENPRAALDIDDPNTSISTGEDQFKKLLQDQLVEETLQPGEGISDWGECRKITEFLHELKKRVFKARDDSKDLNLDTANETEEGIIVNKLSESKIPQPSTRDSMLGASMITPNSGSFVGSMDSIAGGSFVGVSDNNITVRSSATETQPKLDWTNNKPKLKMLQESIAKDKRVMEQCLNIVQEQIASISKIEARIMKLHRTTQATGKSRDSQTFGFKRKVFCRFGWWCLGRRVNLKVQSRSLGLLSDAFNFLEKELENLYDRAYKDESVEKLMSTKAKKNIFSMLSTCMWAEVGLRTLCQQSILTSSFRDYFMTCYLKMMPKSTSQEKIVAASSVEDAKARQKHIREGDKFSPYETQDPSSISPKLKSSTILEVPDDSTMQERKSKRSIDEFQLDQKDHLNSPLTPSRPSKSTTKNNLVQGPVEQVEKEDSPNFIKLEILNKMFSTCFKEWAVNSYFERYVSKKLKKQLNKDRLGCFEEFAITGFKMDSKPVKLNRLQPQPSENFEFLADIDVEYDGLVSINIESTLIVNLTVKEYKIKVNILVKIFQIYGVVRVCLVPLKHGKSW